MVPWCLSHPPTPCPAPQGCIWPRSRAERAPMESTGLQKGLHPNRPEPGRACEVGCKSWNSAHTSSPRHFRGPENSQIPLEFPEHQLFEMPLVCTQPETCANPSAGTLTPCWWEQTRLSPLGNHFCYLSRVLGPNNHRNKAAPKSQRHKQGLAGASSSG